MTRGRRTRRTPGTRCRRARYRPVRFVARGDSLTEGVCDPVGEGPVGLGRTLTPSLGPDTESAVRRRGPTGMEGGGRPGAHHRRTGTNRTGVPGTAWAAAARSSGRTTAITG